MAIDWGATGDMLAGIGALAGAAAVGLVALFGRNALKDFKAQKQVERQLEHAERILASAYQLRAALDSIRSPMSTAAELDESAKKLKEKEGFGDFNKPRLDRFIQANVFYIRARYFDEDFKSAQKLVPYAAAFFGVDVQGALEKLIHNRHVVRVYADAYARDFGPDKDFNQKIQAAIWKGFGVKCGDEVTESTDKSIRLLEDKLFPIIRLPDAKTAKKWTNNA